ncbi:molybdate/tungstate transport system substrate-binding protein [Paraburkholderia youngii]|uniref:extracellular solute-binding protein n=1 Tax=Paraburkholderia youngii TaxID=2782701 RepID=UPI003D24566B
MKSIVRQAIVAFISVSALPLTVATVKAEESLHVAYAGSMGVVMDKALGPAFARKANVQYQGQGEGAYGMARLLASNTMVADVFVSITPGPMKILKRAGLIDRAIPIASTGMVIAFNPKSAFAKRLAASTDAGDDPWWKVLQSPGLRFARTDPKIDPQGQNIIFVMMLAERYYRQPGLANKILGSTANPQQVLGEGGLLTRLEVGQVDASSGYQTAAVSAGLPYIALPDEIDLGARAYAKNWYETASFSIQGANGMMQTLRPQPLVFYAAVLKNAPDALEAMKFVDFVLSPEGQRLCRQYGYGRLKGDPL